MSGEIVIRRAVALGKPYRGYWEELRRDFFCSCNYCTITEHEAQGIGFEIDHYYSQQAHPELVNEYKNLMYSCRPCNRQRVGREPSQALIDAGYCFVKRDEHVYSEQFDIENDRFKPNTRVGHYSIEFGELNRPPLLELRKARRIKSECEDFTKAGVVALRNYRIDRLPQGIRARVIELKKLAPELFRDLTMEIDEILRAFAGADIVVSLADKEAYEKQAAQRRKVRADLRALVPETTSSAGKA